MSIPVNAVKYVKKILKKDIYKKDGYNCISFENHSIPVYYLSEIFGENNCICTNDNYLTVIIIENQNKQAGFIVDGLLGNHEVFNKKPMLPILKIKNISGYTTLSTGEICLIINPFELIRNTVFSDYNSIFEIQNISVEDKKMNLKDKKIVILNNNDNELNFIKNDLSEISNNLINFNNIHSAYDYIQKNDIDIIICSITSISEEVIRLIRYIKSDENYCGIKLVLLSNLTEYELNKKLGECKYNLYYKISNYNKENFINKLAMID